MSDVELDPTLSDEHLAAVATAMLGADDRGAALLDDVEVFVRRFVAFPSEAAAVAVTLWAAHAHLVYAGDNSPRLALLSPEPGSGKTRTLEVLELLVPAPMAVLNASTAPIFRSIEAEKPTLLFDEVDTIFGRHGKDDSTEDLRGLLNSGHRKGASIPRCVGPKHEVMRFPTFAAVALAGLGDLPDTLMSRSVIVRMRRRAPGEKVEPFRRRLHATDGEALHDRLASWAETVAAVVGNAWPAMPDGIEDRPADVWEPLLAIADAAGGTWPERARVACVELCRVAASRDASLGVRLLADLREVFETADALATEHLLDRLHKLDEAPWDDLRGKPLDSRGLARRLRQYDVVSANVRQVDGRVLKGYRREDLWDTWTRYLPPAPAESATSATAAAQTGETAGQAAFPHVADEVADSLPVADANATGRTAATDDTPSDLRRSAGSGCSGPAGTEAPPCPSCDEPLTRPPARRCAAAAFHRAPHEAEVLA